MFGLAICLLLFGIAEIVSNAFHLCRGNVAAIAQSAKKQHQEIPLDSQDKHFFYKAIVMLIIGVLFVISSVLFLAKFNIGKSFIFVNTILLSLYGFSQLIIYYRFWRVWTAFMVYSIPFVVFMYISF